MPALIPSCKEIPEGAIELTGKMNTADDVVDSHVRENVKRFLPQLLHYPPNGKTVSLACGGPSLKANFKTLKRKYDKGQKVVSMNGTHDWLVERGVNPSVHVMVDARELNERFVKNPIPSCKYFISSQCHPSVFERLKGNQVYIWHTDAGKAREIVEKHYFKKAHFITPGCTVGLCSIEILRVLGYVRQEIFGLDSCLFGKRHHSYGQKENDGHKTVPVTIDLRGKEFSCTHWMVSQAYDFQALAYHRKDLELKIHGAGLIAHMVKTGATLEN